MTTDDKAKAGYNAAIALVSYEGQLIWRAFGALLAANAAFTTIAGASLKLFPEQPWAPRLLAGFGLLICAAWLLVLQRQFSYYRYWFAWARHFEGNQFLGPEVGIIRLGKTYGEGGSVEPKEGVPDLPRFPLTARLFRVQWLMSLVIVVFALLHAALFRASFAP